MGPGTATGVSEPDAISKLPPSTDRKMTERPEPPRPTKGQIAISPLQIGPPGYPTRSNGGRNKSRRLNKASRITVSVIPVKVVSVGTETTLKGPTVGRPVKVIFAETIDPMVVLITTSPPSAQV